MSKFPEAEARIFKNVFVCKVCKSKIKAPVLKVLSGRVKCRKCGASKLRPVRKKLRRIFRNISLLLFYKWSLKVLLINHLYNSLLLIIFINYFYEVIMKQTY